MTIIRQPSTASRPATGHTPIFYYGTELPIRERARQLRAATVVLQPYHPLCQTGRFADYFPHARRFVYFNPTAVQPGLLTDPQVRTAILGYDATWDLERLDLRSAAVRRFAIAQGQLASRIEGVHGLFVDDLDRWDHPEGRPHARAVLDAVMAGRTRPAPWFVNRGFGFWDCVPDLAAALLEELSPYQLDHMGPGELSWVSTVVLRALSHARTCGADVYCLTYDPAAAGWQPRGAAARAVAAVAGEPILARRLLDSWPHMLAKED
jgi:hypothetical protein